MALEGFGHCETIIDGTRMVVRSGDNLLPFYSERSATRDAENLQRLLSPQRAGVTRLVIAPYRDAFVNVLKTSPGGILVAPCAFSPPPSVSNLISNTSELEFFINAIQPEDKFEIIALPQWGSLTEAMIAALEHALARAAVRLKTIRHFEKLWHINISLNARNARNYGDIRELNQAPDLLVMAGPTLETVPTAKHIWCADTAYPVLLAQKISPEVIFSVDAGFASQEHLLGAPTHESTLVTDLLGAPPIQRKSFQKILTYKSSHPLVESLLSLQDQTFSPVTNPNGDVGSLMLEIYRMLFNDRPIKIIGYDRGQRRYVTHARGTAYFTRTFARQTRLFNVETYMRNLSARYAL